MRGDWTTKFLLHKKYLLNYGSRARTVWNCSEIWSLGCLAMVFFPGKCCASEVAQLLFQGICNNAVSNNFPIFLPPSPIQVSFQDTHSPTVELLLSLYTCFSHNFLDMYHAKHLSHAKGLNDNLR
jgi:hypothetical protein